MTEVMAPWVLLSSLKLHPRFPHLQYVFSLCLSPAHREYMKRRKETSNERRQGDMIVQKWDVISSEASREALSFSDDSSSWSQLHQLSVSWVYLHTCTGMILLKVCSYHWQSSSVFSLQPVILYIMLYLFDKQLHIHVYFVCLHWFNTKKQRKKVKLDTIPHRTQTINWTNIWHSQLYVW